MARTQVGYNPQAEVTQVTAAPNIRTEQARFDPRGSSAFQLAEALGAAAPQIEQVKQRVDEKTVNEARQFAQSQSAKDLQKMIKEGLLLPSSSPLYVATVQRVYGENLHNQLKDEVASEIARGERRFANAADLDAHITKRREEMLAGASEYTLAGFDKDYNNTRQSLIDANVRKTDKEFVDSAMAQASVNLVGTWKQASGLDTAGKVEAVLGQYAMQRRGGMYLQDPDQAKAALRGVMMSMAQEGDKDTVSAMLDARLDSGSTVRETLGADHAMQLYNGADAAFRKKEGKRVDVELEPHALSSKDGNLNVKQFLEWAHDPSNREYLHAGTIASIIGQNESAQDRMQRANARHELDMQILLRRQQIAQAVKIAVDSGKFAQMNPWKEIAHNGDEKDANLEDYAVEYIRNEKQRAEAAGKPWSAEEETKMYSANGIISKEMKGRINSAWMNVASLGWGENGKKLGEMNETSAAGVEEFMRVNKTNRQYAAKLVGDNETYEALDTIMQMVESGGAGSIEEASRWVAEGYNRHLDPKVYNGKLAKLDGAVNDVLYTRTGERTMDWLKGFFGNDVPNLTLLENAIFTRSKVLVRAGMEPEEAVQSTVQYLANPATRVKVNNIVYPRHALPDIGDENGNIEYWMQRYKDEVPAKIAGAQGVNAKNLVLFPTTFGTFVVKNGGNFLLDKNNHRVEFTKGDFQKWVKQSMEYDLTQKTATANFESFKDRLQGEIKELDGYAIDKYDTRAGNPVFNKNFLSRGGYDRIVKDGNHRKPLRELMKLYPNLSKGK